MLTFGIAMLIKSPTARSTSHPYGWPFLCVFALALAYTLDLTRRLAHFDLIFWDAKVYARALHAFATGSNPYAHSADLNFVYSPSFLWVGSTLGHFFPGHSGWYLYLALNAAAVFFVPIILARVYLRAPWFTPPVAMAVFFFHPLLTAQTAFTSGNIGTILYALILAAGAPGLRHNRWHLFYVAVVCGAIIKPTLLAFLLLPLLLGAGQVIPGFIALATVVLEMALERHFAPALYNGFLASAYYQVFVLKDVGFGLLSHLQFVANRVHGLHQNSAFIASVATTAASFLCFWLLRKTRRQALPESIWTAAILVTAVLANFRLLAYDADIAVLPAAFILIEAVRSLLHHKTSPLAIALPGALFTVLLAKEPKSALLTFFVASVLIALIGIPVRRSARQVDWEEPERVIPRAA